MMNALRFSIVAGFVLTLTAATVQAGDVIVKNVHICCGACVKAVDGSLKDVTGVTNAKADTKSKIVSFTAEDDKAAEAGIKALAKAGFHGAATHDSKKLDFPDSGAKKGDKSNSITLNGVHLCCGGCKSTVQKAFRGLKGVLDLKCDSRAKTVALTGIEIDVVAAVAALNKAGFHGSLK